jgi:hypothetical protein
MHIGAGMVKHVVLWKFRDFAEGASREENLKKAKTLLELLRNRIPEIRRLEVGIDVSQTDHSYDLLLNSEFADGHSLQEYQKHPDHVRVVEFLRKVHEGRIVVDYLV